MATKRIALILVWAVSLIIVGAFARAQTPAQRGIISGVTLDSGLNVNAATA